MGDAITLDQVRQSKWSFFTHLNMGRYGHVLVHRNIDYPRLMVSKRSKRGLRAGQTITVDGVEVADLAAAIVALNTPPAADAPQCPFESAAGFVAAATESAEPKPAVRQLTLDLR